jgi:hypothetical protein
MNNDPEDDRRRLSAFWRDELRRASAEAPGFEELAAYVEERLDADARAAFEERLEADPALRLEVADLRALRDSMQRPVRSAWRSPVAFAGLAAAAAVAALAFWLGRPAEKRAIERAGQPTLAAAPAASIKDGLRQVALGGNGALSGLPALDPALERRIAAALSGSLPSPQGLGALQGEPLTLLGQPGTAARFGPTAPLGTRVSVDRPTLRWSPHPDAPAYEVSVFDQELRKRAGSGRITGTEWTPERALPRGRTYLWQVAALTRHGRVTAPAPPAPEARFEIVSDAVRAELERRQASAPDSHLAALVLCVEAGLLDDADVQLQSLDTDNPGSAEVGRLRGALQALRLVTSAPAASPRR